MFPSPCGDVVLKFARKIRVRTRIVVSVPLRGCGFEIVCIGLRGNTVRSQFPSPCGDVVLKFLLRLVFRMEDLTFPSPCGDVVLKSLRLGALCGAAQNSILRRGSKQHFAARIGFSPVSRRQRVLKTTASHTALGAARISLLL